MTRTERIAEAQARVDALRPALDQFKEASRDLKRALESFDPGERVRVELTCNRGCCVEQRFEGTVEPDTSPHNRDGMYSVRRADGTLRENVYCGDMQRL